MEDNYSLSINKQRPFTPILVGFRLNLQGRQRALNKLSDDLTPLQRQRDFENFLCCNYRFTLLATMFYFCKDYSIRQPSFMQNRQSTQPQLNPRSLLRSPCDDLGQLDNSNPVKKSLGIA